MHSVSILALATLSLVAAAPTPMTGTPAVCANICNAAVKELYIINNAFLACQNELYVGFLSDCITCAHMNGEDLGGYQQLVKCS